MPPTTGYNFGDVVLVPFPFTNQAGAKKRPAVIISSAAYNTAQRDFIIMAVTSQLRPLGALGEAPVADWEAAGLIKPSAIKPVITTIEQALVIRRLGQLTTEDQQALRSAIAKIVG
ncbi:MAG: type II toxin-antitoxin system PemK/MazF family toxin [Burkholderiales bacterium]|nr:type II toxin-antitoxin system PemK/MazF family toxin [Burkholderiales bacterium]